MLIHTRINIVNLSLGCMQYKYTSVFSALSLKGTWYFDELIKAMLWLDERVTISGLTGKKREILCHTSRFKEFYLAFVVYDYMCVYIYVSVIYFVCKSHVFCFFFSGKTGWFMWFFLSADTYLTALQVICTQDFQIWLWKIKER